VLKIRRDRVDHPRVKPFGHPLRVRIYQLVDDRGEMSPMEMARALGSTVEIVAYHVRVLVDAGVLALAGTKPVRGAVQHFYEIPADGPKAPAGSPEVFVSQECAADGLEETLIDVVAAATAGVPTEGRVRVTCLVERVED
jgi:DNA-binding transcriptional ArsR family regulator